MTQEEVAELLSRHKSWVCRRLALVEKLADPARRTCGWGSVGHRRTVAGPVAGRQPSPRAGQRLPPRQADRRRARRRGRPAPGCRRAGPRSSTSWTSRARPCGKRGRKPAGPRTRGSAHRATAWRDVDLRLGGPPPGWRPALRPRPRRPNALRSAGPDAGILPVDP